MVLCCCSGNETRKKRKKGCSETKGLECQRDRHKLLQRRFRGRKDQITGMALSHVWSVDFAKETKYSRRTMEITHAL